MRTSAAAFESAGSVHVTSIDAHDGGSVTIPDAHFLFHADFKRTGSDLTLTGQDGHRVVVPGYFKHEHLPTLLSPEGAALTGDLVEALAGSQAPDQYAQAGAATLPSGIPAIGRVASVQGTATAVRNGVIVTLNVGEMVLKGDVIQTGSDSAVGVIFSDGTTFNLTADARMVLNDFVYSPGGSSNAALINLVQGSFTFIAGEVAHTGDLKVGTPVATMGIRGTAVSVTIQADNGATNISVMAQGDNLTHSVTVYALPTPADLAAGRFVGAVLGVVTNNGGVFSFTPTPTGLLVQETGKDAVTLQTELNIVQQVFQTQSVGQQILQQQPLPSNTDPTHGPTGTQITTGPSDIPKIDVTVVSVPGSPGVYQVTNVQTLPASNSQPLPPLPPNNPDNPALPPTPTNLPPHFDLAPTRVAAFDSGHNPLNAIGPQVSADGLHVAFMVADGTPHQGNNGHDATVTDVVLYDRTTGAGTSLVSAITGTTLHDGEDFGSIPSISADGRYVVFGGEYQAPDTVTLNGHQYTFSADHLETFLYDSQTGQSTLLSADGGRAAISADGHYVAVETNREVTINSGTYLILDHDIEIMDRACGTVVATIAVTDTALRANAENGIEDPSLSANGRFVTFDTTASAIDVTIGCDALHFDLVANPDHKSQVYIYDLQNPDNAPQLVSVTASGGAGNADSGQLITSDFPSVTTPDNTTVTFSSDQFQSFDEDGNPIGADVQITSVPTVGTLSFDGSPVTAGLVITLADIGAGKLTFTPAAGGHGADYASFTYQSVNTGDFDFVPQTMTINVGDQDNWAPAMSADGRYVVFQSNASDLVAGDTNGRADVFLYDRQTGTVDRISNDLTSDSANFGDSFRPAISADGRYITYVSFASDLVAGDTNGFADVFLYDRLTGTTTDLTAGFNGDSQWGTSVSNDGTVIAYGSEASNIVTPDLNGHADVFILNTAGAAGNVADNSHESTLTASGTLAFGDNENLTGDAHTVGVVAQDGDFGTLVPTVTTDTTGSSTNGVVSWTYTVDESQAASLSAGQVHTDVFTVTLTDSAGGTDNVVVNVNIVGTNAVPPPPSVPADGIHYWASNTHGDVTPINHISFSDVDAGCSPVTVTFTSDNCGDALDATNLCGSGVSVLCGNDSSQIKLEGSISDINTYLFNGNLLWNPDGSPNHASAQLTVSMDDNGTAPGGNVVSSTVEISEICNPDFCGSSTQDFSNVNFTNVCAVDAGSGCDTITTSWNHQGAATVYDGGGGDDTIHLLFTPDQLAEIVADQCTQDALLSYIQGPCGQTLNLSGTSWNAEAQNFEHADINLVTGYGSGTLSSVNTLISQPDFIVGTSGNDCNLSGAGCGNHVIVGLDGNDTLTGGAGNDGLIGGAGNDILVGGPGNDVLSGGAGNDTFRFTETSCGHANFGNDIVVDYHPGEDSIEIGQDIFANLAALRAATTDDCHGNAVITVDCNNSITLSGVSTADVIAHQSDFHLVA